MTVSVNGKVLDATHFESAKLAAVHELLRQRAIALGLLDAEPEDEAAARTAIDRLLEKEVPVPTPTEEECRRYYERNRKEFRVGELIYARHILFQVTRRVPLNHLRAKAENVLMDLLRSPDDFAARAKELSNCPSGASGGNLGQLSRGSTVPEFEKAVFESTKTGIFPALVKTRYGFHIVAVDRRVPGKDIPFEIARPKIAERLRGAVERRALAQYVALLAGEAEIEGVDLNAASTPLVQ